MAIGTLKRTDKVPLEDGYEKEIEEELVQIYSANQMYVQLMESLKEVQLVIIINRIVECVLWMIIHIIRLIHRNHQQNNYMQINRIMTPFTYSLMTTYRSIIFILTSRNEGNLVQVIDAVTNEPISRKKSMNKYLVHVDILDMIKDQDYFTKFIDQCEKLRNEEIDRIEKGIPDEVAESVKKTDWELLEESTDADYLRKTILPLLIPGLQLLELERPENPISFLALYCLKNKENVKLPIPPEQLE